MRIGEIAKLTGLNISNIRFYRRLTLKCTLKDTGDHGMMRKKKGVESLRIVCRWRT